MSGSSPMLPMEEELEEIVALVWQTVLGGEAPPRASTTDAPCALQVAELGIQGAWNGTFELEADPVFAQAAAAARFGADGAAAAEQEEARREVANMLAGNAKALLPGPSTLGIPAVRRPHAPSSLATRLAYGGPHTGQFTVTLTPESGWGGGPEASSSGS